MTETERKIATNAITNKAPELARDLLDMLGDELGLFHVMRVDERTGNAGIVVVCNESVGCTALYQLVRRIQDLSHVETTIEAAVPPPAPRSKRGIA